MIPIERVKKKESQLLEEGLQRLVDDYLTQKQTSLMQMKKGLIDKKAFLQEVENHVRMYYELTPRARTELLKAFEQYIFGYSHLSPLIDDAGISDIRVVGYNNIRVKREGKRMDAGVSFSSEKEYRQFIDYVATKNQVNISNLNAIQRFTDTESHPEFILRFTLSMPLVNTYNEPYLCIRKVPKNFPLMRELIRREMLDQETAELLIERFREGSTLICGGNSSGKTTMLNALKETLPNDVAVLVTQQADELTTKFHPDMMFLHALTGTGEQQVSYGLEEISIAGLTMDVDFFIIGEVLFIGEFWKIFFIKQTVNFNFFCFRNTQVHVYHFINRSF
jgi:pilus assembly protein CpaF